MMLSCELLPLLLICQIPVVISLSRQLPFEDDERSLYQNQMFNSFVRSPREAKQAGNVPKNVVPREAIPDSLGDSGTEPPETVTFAKIARPLPTAMAKPLIIRATSKPSVTPHTQLSHLLSIEDKTNLLRLIDSVDIIDEQMKALSNRQTLVPTEPSAADKDNLIHIQKAFVSIQMDLKGINVNNRKTVFNVRRKAQDNEQLADIKAQFDEIKAHTEKIMNRGTLFSINKEPKTPDENNILRMKGELEIIDGILNSMQIKSSTKQARPPLSVEDKQRLLKLSDAAKMSSSQFDYLLTRGTFIQSKVNKVDKDALSKIKAIFRAITTRINKIDPENRKTASMSSTSAALSPADRAVLPSIKKAVLTLRFEIRSFSQRGTLIPDGKTMNVEDEDSLIRIRSGIDTMVSVLERLTVSSGNVTRPVVAATKPKAAVVKRKVRRDIPRAMKQASAPVPEILSKSSSNIATPVETTKTTNLKPPLSVKDKTHLLTIQNSIKIILNEMEGLENRKTLINTEPDIADKASVSRIRNSLAEIQRYLQMLDIDDRTSIMDPTGERNTQDEDFIKQIVAEFAITNKESQELKTRGTLFSQKEPTASDEASLLRIKGEMENIDTMLQTLAPKKKKSSKPPLSITAKGALLKLNDAAKTAASEFGKLLARRIENKIPLDANDKATVSKINLQLKKIQTKMADIDVENRNTAFSKTSSASEEDSAPLLAIKASLTSLRDQVDILANRNTFFQNQSHLIVGDQNSLIRFKIGMDAMGSMLKKLGV